MYIPTFLHENKFMGIMKVVRSYHTPRNLYAINMLFSTL